MKVAEAPIQPRASHTTSAGEWARAMFRGWLRYLTGRAPANCHRPQPEVEEVAQTPGIGGRTYDRGDLLSLTRSAGPCQPAWWIGRTRISFTSAPGGWVRANMTVRATSS